MESGVYLAVRAKRVESLWCRKTKSHRDSASYLYSPALCWCGAVVGSRFGTGSSSILQVMFNFHLEKYRTGPEVAGFIITFFFHPAPARFFPSSFGTRGCGVWARKIGLCVIFPLQ
eukprot:RCo006657